MSLEVEQLANGGVNGPALVRRTPFRDGRGQFSRLFAREELAAAGLGFEIVHVNHSATTGKGTVRGFHYQRQPHGETKLVTCIRGAVLDIADGDLSDADAASLAYMVQEEKLAHDLYVTLGEEWDLRIYDTVTPYQGQNAWKFRFPKQNLCCHEDSFINNYYRNVYIY